nr:hypothetical protein [Tanacetum cinerariifolium]
MSSDSASSEVTYTSITSYGAPLSPEFDPKHEIPDDDMIVVKDQPYADYASLVALSPRYVGDSDLEEDFEDGLVDYPAD